MHPPLKVKINPPPQKKERKRYIDCLLVVGLLDLENNTSTVYENCSTAKGQNVTSKKMAASDDRPLIRKISTGYYLLNVSSDPLHVWFYGRVFGVGGLNGATSGSTKSKMAASLKISNGHISATGHPEVAPFDPPTTKILP